MNAHKDDPGKREIEHPNPADDEPILDRIDLTKGFVPGKVIVISGKAYKMRHRLGMSLREIAQSAGIVIK